jgi:putative phosphoesterase
LIAIISDIHGNFPALESVLKDMEQYHVEQIISLGDIAGYYPFINEVICKLKTKNVINIIGNHDRYMLDKIECPRSYSANVCLNYQKKVITKENFKWLKNSISKIDFDNVSMVHGGWINNEDEYIFKVKDSYFEGINYKYFFCGHTHVQKKVTMKNQKFFINPGSVGQPRDGDCKAAYCLFDLIKKEVIFKRISYNIDIIASKMRELGFEKKFYENLYKGTRIGGKKDMISYERLT